MPTFRKIASQDAPTSEDRQPESWQVESFEGGDTFNVPIGWAWIRAEQICDAVVSGSTPSAEKMNARGGEIPYIKVYNLTFHGRLDFSIKPTFIDKDTHYGQLARSRVFPNDVLINIVGPPLGKVARVPDVHSEWNINQAIVAFRPSRYIDSRFLCYTLMSQLVRVQLESTAKATAGQYNIAVTTCRKIFFPLPPLVEQRRIVAAIEQQLTRLDAGVAALKAAQARLQRYKAAVLKAACEGRLAPQDPADEPADALLRRILSERRAKWEGEQEAKLRAQGRMLLDDGWRAKYQEPEGPDTTGLPALPQGWVWTNIDQVAECLDYRRIPINKKERETRIGEFPYYGANGQVGWIDDFLFDEPLVLVVEDETFTGREKPFSYKIIGKTWVNNHAHVLRSTGSVDIDYLNYSLAFYPFTPLTTGTTGRKKLTQQALMSAPYALPPLAEQQRIVAEVERRLSVVAEVEAAVAINLKRAERLRQAILKRAFEGKLVPQDPSDEPASALLERIRAEREQPAESQGAKRGRKRKGEQLRMEDF